METNKQTKNDKKITKWEILEMQSLLFLITLNNDFGERGAYIYAASVGGVLLGGGLLVGWKNFPRWVKKQRMLRKNSRKKEQSQ